MKKILLFLFLFISSVYCDGQNSLEQMKSKLAVSKVDSSYVNLCLHISKYFLKSNLDSALVYSKMAVTAAEKTKDKGLIFYSADIYGYTLFKKGILKDAKGPLIKAYNLGKQLPIADQYFYNLFHIADLYFQEKNKDSAQFFLMLAFNKSETPGNKAMHCQSYSNLGEF